MQLFDYPSSLKLLLRDQNLINIWWISNLLEKVQPISEYEKTGAGNIKWMTTKSYDPSISIENPTMTVKWKAVPLIEFVSTCT